MRTLRAAAVLALGVLVLASTGCQGQQAVAAVSQQARAKLDQPVQLLEENETERRVRHPLGETRLPAHPQRVLPLGFSVADALILLGVKPIASPLHMSHASGAFADYERPFLRDVDGLHPVDTGLEAYLAEHPDLILVDAAAGKSLNQLNQIAPTVVVGSSDPRQRLLDVGTVLGLREKAQARVLEYDGKLALAREQLAPAITSQTVALLRMHIRQFRLYGNTQGGAAAVYHELGFKPARLVQEKVIGPKQGVVSLSEESLAELDADHLFLFVDPPARERTLHLLEQNPAWAQISAVRRGQVHLVSSALIFDSLLAREQIVDDVLAAFGKPRLFGTDASL